MVTLSPGNLNSATGTDDNYLIGNVPTGNYELRVTYVGFADAVRQIEVLEDLTVDLNISSTGYTTETIEINRAKDRETPVAFSDIDQRTLEERMSGQDAPLLIRNVPGFYSYATDGVGNGEAQLLIRGFSQNYVQVLINGIPTNDPESNSVYWSNWESVSANAGSIQIQRGAGSSLYGSESFGGSFNIVTEIPPLKPFYGANITLGTPLNSLYRIKLNSGLLSKRFTASLNVERKIAEGTRISGRYKGINYYTSASFFPSADQNFKLVLHGAPQEHGYSFSNSISYFKMFGFEANSAPFLSRDIVNSLPANPNNGEPHYALLNDTRELVDDKFVNISHNFSHKPQLELHHYLTFKNNSILKTTLFYTIGRGGGSSINGNGTTFSFRKGMGLNGMTIDTLITNLLGHEGYISSVGVADTVYLRNAFQRISYSLHSQYGIMSSYQTDILKNFRLTGGFEVRNWKADHPGHFVNLFGKTSIAQTYAARDTAGNIVSFSRRVYQGDLDAPGDLGNPFGWNMVTDNGTYNTQYRNYLGETPQLTLFTQMNYNIGELNLMGTLQYVWYKYKLTENMPSENAIGRQLTASEVSSLGISEEGARGDKFYMKGTNERFYEFDLVRADRSRGFIQPKIGFNYNASKNFNIFGNFAHVERFVDLGVYYNQGRINNDAEDEKSNQFDLGFGWISGDLYAKVNAYYMTWDNKSARIQDVSKAGEPGYDRNGFRTELIGSSDNKGIELEMSYSLDKFLPVKGLGLKGSFTFMDNKWTDVLDQVKTDPLTGMRRAFNTGALNADGNIDTLFFDELNGTPVASGPQLMASLGLNYYHQSYFGSVDASLVDRFYMLDGGTYAAVDGEFVGVDAAGRLLFRSEYKDQLPSSVIVNVNIGRNFEINRFLKGSLTFQLLNVFDTEYLSAADRFGVIPGMGRTFRANLSLGL